MNEKVHFDVVHLSVLDQSFDLGLDKPAQADDLLDSKQVYDFQESLTAFVDQLLPDRDLKVVQRNAFDTLGPWPLTSHSSKGSCNSSNLI